MDFSQALIDKLVIHKIGNKAEEEGFTLSRTEITEISEDTETLLHTFFLGKFKSNELYKFNLETCVSEESVFTSISKLFSDEDQFYIQSANIGKRLYEVSTHPNIKTGELYVVYFNNVIIDDFVTDAVGIFKSENKETFLKVYLENDNFDVEYQDGISIKKLDKGCIIANKDAEEGYLIKLLDNTNKNKEAIYWVEDFIQAKVIENNFFNTSTFMEMCKDFSDNVLTQRNNVEKSEQIGFMTKSFDYLMQNPVFDEEDFKERVINNPEVIERFDDFKNDFETTHEVRPKTEFEVDKDALKKTKKFVKSVIKLDRNFHIYVHSRPEYLEKGYDKDRQLSFYKLYFEQEA